MSNITSFENLEDSEKSLFFHFCITCFKIIVFYLYLCSFTFFVTRLEIHKTYCYQRFSQSIILGIGANSVIQILLNLSGNFKWFLYQLLNLELVLYTQL